MIILVQANVRSLEIKKKNRCEQAETVIGLILFCLLGVLPAGLVTVVFMLIMVVFLLLVRCLTCNTIRVPYKKAISRYIFYFFLGLSLFPFIFPIGFYYLVRCLVKKCFPCESLSNDDSIEDVV